MGSVLTSRRSAGVAPLHADVCTLVPRVQMRVCFHTLLLLTSTVPEGPPTLQGQFSDLPVHQRHQQGWSRCGPQALRRLLLVRVQQVVLLEGVGPPLQEARSPGAAPYATREGPDPSLGSWAASLPWVASLEKPKGEGSGRKSHPRGLAWPMRGSSSLHPLEEGPLLPYSAEPWPVQEGQGGVLGALQGGETKRDVLACLRGMRQEQRGCHTELDTRHGRGTPATGVLS